MTGLLRYGALAAGARQIAQSVVREVSDATGEPPRRLDDSIDGFGGADGASLGLEVVQDLLPRGLQSPSVPGDLWDGAFREGFQRRGHEFRPAFRGGIVDGPDSLVAPPSPGDFVVRVPGFQLRIQAGDQVPGEVFGAYSQGSVGSGRAGRPCVRDARACPVEPAA